MDEKSPESSVADREFVEANTSTYLPSSAICTSSPVCQPDSTSMEHDEPLDEDNHYNILQSDNKNSNVSSSEKSNSYYSYNMKRSKSVDVRLRDDTSDKEKKSSSREMKALINSAKESKIINEFTQVASKVRRSRKDADSPHRAPGGITKKRRYSLQSNLSDSNRRSMRSSNPEFVTKQRKFLSSVSGKEQKRPTAGSGSDSDSERSASELNTPGKNSIRKKMTKKGKKGKSEAHPVELTTKVDGRPRDPFCWRCHSDIRYESARSKTPSTFTARCSVCPRSYHVRCIKGMVLSPDSNMQEWVCPECASILHDENIDNSSKAMRSLSLSNLCNLLQFALDIMKKVTGVEPFLNPVDDGLQSDYKKYIVYPVDLSALSANIAAKKYGSTTAFSAETKWILHNSIIYNSQSSKLTTIAKAILNSCKAEMAEIEVCPNCYEGAYTYNENFFTDVCENPHILLWAKLKGYPYWPAKGVGFADNMSVAVRFFGAHDRSRIPSKYCYLYSDKDPNRRQRNHDVREAVKEMEEHIKNVKKKFGNFQYAPLKAPFYPLKLKEHLQTMIPNLRNVDLSSHQEKITKEVALKKPRTDSDLQSIIEGYGTEDDEDVLGRLNIDARMKYVKEIRNEDGELILEIASSSNSSTESSPVKNDSRKRPYSPGDLDCLIKVIDKKIYDSPAVKHLKQKSTFEESIAEPPIKISITEHPKHKSKAEQMKDKSNAEQLKNKSTAEKPKDKRKESPPSALKKLERVINNNNATSRMNIFKNFIPDEKANTMAEKKSQNTTTTNKSLSVSSNTSIQNPIRNLQQRDSDIPNVNVFKRTITSEMLSSNLSVRLDQLNFENIFSLSSSETNNAFITSNPAKKELDNEIGELHKDTSELSNDGFGITDVISLSDTVEENITNNDQIINSTIRNIDSNKNALNVDTNDDIPTFVLPIDDNVSDSSKELTDKAPILEMNGNNHVSRSSIEKTGNVNSKENEERAENVTDKVLNDSGKNRLNLTDNTDKPVAYKINVIPDSKLFITPPTIISQPEKVLSSSQNGEEILTEPMATQKKNLLQNLELLPSHEANKPSSVSRPNEKQMRVHRSLTNKIRMLDPDNGQESNMGRIIEALATNNVPKNNTSRVAADIALNNSSKQIHRAKKSFPQAIKQHQATLLKQYVGPAPDAKKVMIRTTAGLSGNNTVVYIPIEHDKNMVSSGKNIINKNISRLSEPMLLPTLTLRSSDSHTSTSSPLFQVSSLPGSVGNQPMMEVSPASALASSNMPMINAPQILTPPPVMATKNSVNSPQVPENRGQHTIDISDFCRNSTSNGPMHNLLNSVVNKMTDNFKVIIVETLLDMSQNGNLEAKLRLMALELEATKEKLENIKRSNQEELKEMKHNYQLMITEIKASFETEHKRQIAKVKLDCAAEKNKAIAETKTMQWCANCASKASLHCCWNTAYCSKQCQWAHWDGHEECCTREYSGSSFKPIQLTQVKAKRGTGDITGLNVASPTHIYVSKHSGQLPILMPNGADSSSITNKGNAAGYINNNVAGTTLSTANLSSAIQSRKVIIKGTPGNQVAIPVHSEGPSMTADQTLPRTTSNYIMMKTSTPSSSKQMHINTTNPQ